MVSQILQPDLFDTASPRYHRLPDTVLTEYPEAFSIGKTEEYFEKLHQNINWESARIRIAGRTLPIPRLQCWVGDPSASYRYSGISMEPRPWNRELQEIRGRVQELAGREFNAVLLNLYRNGQDSVAWHADDEPELGPDPVVASVSLGASRPFELRHKTRRDLDKVRLMLHSGSVLVMEKGCQDNWLHQLPKVKSLSEPRINLTFRTYVGSVTD